jgi:hypothetical protein
MAFSARYDLLSLYAGSNTNNINTKAAAVYQILARDRAQCNGAAKATDMRKMPPRWTPPTNRFMWIAPLIGSKSIKLPQVALPK